MLKEARHLFIFLSNLGELTLNDLLQVLLEFVLKCSDRRRDNVAELVVKRISLVNRLAHVDQVDEVLGVGLLKLIGWDIGLVVYLFVLLNGFCEQLLSLRHLSFVVTHVATAKSTNEGLSRVELLNSDSQVGSCLAHTFTLGGGSVVLGLSELPVRLSLEVPCVVGHHIGVLSVVV